jgi:hypothetical protein
MLAAVAQARTDLTAEAEADLTPLSAPLRRDGQAPADVHYADAVALARSHYAQFMLNKDAAWRTGAMRRRR